jgi:hypothetical protein
MNRYLGSETSRKRLRRSVGLIESYTLRFLLGAGAVAALGVAVTPEAMAFNLYDGSRAGNNLEVNLTTTLSYSGFLRVNDPSQILAGPTDANGNDGDSNFQHGIVGNQFEILPVFDIRDGDYGAHFSGEAFLNTVYLQPNQNSQPSTFNSIYSTSNQNFTSGTRNVNGQDAKLLDAFVFGQHEFSGGQQVQLKVGRQTLFWGQSLFFANNGISAGQAPIDIISAQDTPNAEAQQVFLPVGQAVLTYRPGIGGLTFQGYYQFEWQHDNFQGAGAYFNGADYLNAGGQTVIAGAFPGVGNLYLLRNKDLNPEPGNGQFGLSAQDEFGDYDVGVYGMRWDAKAPVVYDNPLPQSGWTPVPGGLKIGSYTLVYPRDIQTYGTSLSTNIGQANVAGEISDRVNMPLLPAGFGTQTPSNPGNANSDPLYPVGNVFYGQASMIYLSPGLPLVPGGITFTGEVAMNHLISVTKNRDQLRPNGQATAAAFDFVITPAYYDVLPSLNITLPIGLNYNFLGRSEVDQSMQHGTATFNVGVNANYLNIWNATLTYQDYLGKPTTLADDTTYNTLADRGYVSLNLQRSF